MDVEGAVGSFIVVPIWMAVGEVGLNGIIKELASSDRSFVRIDGREFEGDFREVRFNGGSLRVAGGEQVATDQVGDPLGAIEVVLKAPDGRYFVMPMRGRCPQGLCCQQKQGSAWIDAFGNVGFHFGGGVEPPQGLYARRRPQLMGCV